MARRKGPGRSAAPERPATKKTKAKTRSTAPAGGGGPEVVSKAAVATEDEKRAAMEAVVQAAKKDDTAQTTATSTKLTLGKAIKKAAAVTGFDGKHIGWWVKNRDRDPEEVQRERDADIFGQNRVAAFMNMPLHGQFALLPDGATVASSTPTEREQKKDSDPQILAAAEAQGLEAGKAGANFGDNPYPAGSKRAAKWGAGYKLGQKELGAGIKPTQKSPTHNEPAHA